MNTQPNNTAETRAGAMFPLLALAAALLLTTGAGIKTGEEFPKLSSFKLEGKVPDVLEGKVVIVDFWASWCGPCAASFPAMEELHQRYKDEGLVIVAVSVDDKAEKMNDFLKKHTASFAVVRDAEKKLVTTADVSTMPTSFLIDRNGKVRFTHSGFRGEPTKKQYVEEIESLLKESK